MKSNITELKLDDMQNVTGGAVYALAYSSTTMLKAPSTSTSSLPPPPSLPPIY